MKKEAITKGKIYFSPKNLKWEDKYIGFISRKQIRLVVSGNFKDWSIYKKPIIASRKGYFDKGPLKILNIFSIKQGIFLLYFVLKPFAIGATILSKKNPTQVLWRSANPIYKANQKIFPIKARKKQDLVKITVKNKKTNKVGIINFSINQIIASFLNKKLTFLKRSDKNPILSPSIINFWENKATFNPAAIYLKDKIHFLYRAIGLSNQSVLGYAASLDGINIHEKSPQPVFTPEYDFKDNGSYFSYGSGGSWGGCEDPRLTKIKDKIYMTYTSFDGMSPPRVALSSIKVNNFLRRKWIWKKPVFISPPGEIHKNWVIFPEKINGKYAILHSISPDILVDYFKDLNFDGNTFINSYYSPSGKQEDWDSHLRGPGPPPIKTKDGWLLFYHAMDEKDPGKYKIGAMVLDYNNPKHILYKSKSPVLEPEKIYENNGHKPGVIYCCGALVKDNKLFIYYGGADKVVCAASANLNKFLNQIKNYKTPSLKIT